MSAPEAVAEEAQGRTSNTPPPKCQAIESHAKRSERLTVCDGPRSVGNGIDTFEFGFHAILAGSGDTRLWDDLDTQKAKAQRGLKPLRHFGGAVFEILPHGGGSVYAWRLQNEHFGVSLGRHEPGSTPTLAVRPECALLWEVGPEVAWVMAQDLAQSVDVTGARPEGCLSRIDLAADFQGVPFQDAPRESFVARASTLRERGLVRGRPVNEGSRAARARVLSQAGPEALAVLEAGSVYERETLSFGSGGIVTRIYNKTREIRAGGGAKDFFPRLVWPKSGRYDESEPVWRVEVQLRREFLRELAVSVPLKTQDPPLYGPVERLSPDTIRGVLASLPSWWRYAVGRAGATERQGENGWLSWREPTRNPQRTRWPVRPEWDVVRRVPWEEPVAAEGVRGRVRNAKAEQLEAMAVGCMSSVAALRGHVVTGQVLDDFAEAFLREMTEAAVEPGAVRRKGFEATDAVERGFYSRVAKRAVRMNVEHEFAAALTA